MRKICRDYDYIARMGGDEFVAVIPGVGLELVPPMIERFQAAVRRVGVEVCREPVVSISIGWATLPGDPSEPEKLLNAADLRMYRAKKASRDLREAATVTPGLDEVGVPVTMTLQ
jgi:diguanylate cyclase (GGDEF)-like protein